MQDCGFEVAGCCFKEEVDEVLVGVFFADGAQGGDVFFSFFAMDYQQGVSEFCKYPVAKQSGHAAIAVAEGVQVYEISMKAG